MAKLKIEDLSYIAMEGGGASGVVYNGAIKALEEKLKEKYPQVPGSAGALLDYYDGENRRKLKIKGIAGSSAGAINAFALALGLSAQQIDEDIMQKVSFIDFLSEYDEGCYRMIGADGELLIGRGRKPLGKTKKAFSFGKKVNANFWAVTSRNLFLNLITRALFAGVSDTLQEFSRMFGKTQNNPRLNAFLDETIGQTGYGENTAFSAIQNGLNLLISGDGSGVANDVTRNPDNRNKARFNLFTSMLWNRGLLWVLRKVFKIDPKHTGMKINYRSIGNLIWDRGFFSGFIVREFFMDLVIHSALNNTHFHRQLTNPDWNKKANATLKKDVFKFDALKESLLSMGEKVRNKGKKNEEKGFEFLYRRNRKSSFSKSLSPEEKTILNTLVDFIQKMNFAQFYELTGVQFGVCVSNFSTDQPIYFSHDYTPNFIVIEAVAASMTIPPAIKPLYNEMDVISQERKISFTHRVKVIEDKKEKIVTTQRIFCDDSGKFSNSDYYELEMVVKKHLQNKSIEKNNYIDLNNKMGSASYLQLLRKEVLQNPNAQSLNVTFENQEYVFQKNLLIFFYNAAYKGLLIDGGYRNNIPYNFFREEGFYDISKPSGKNSADNALIKYLAFRWNEGFYDTSDLSDNKATANVLKNVLALKLDNSFPLSTQSQFYKCCETLCAKHGKAIFKRSILFMKKSFEDQKTIERIIKELEATSNSALNEMFSKDNATIISIVNTLQDTIKKLVPIDGYGNSKEINYCLKKSAVALLDKYFAENEHTPWSKNKAILSTAMEGYEFGTGDGQIRYMSDHNYIIPLYNYGVTTFDFNFKEKLMPLVKLANKHSENALNAYF